MVRSNIILSLKNVSKTLGDKTILDDISLDIRKGEFVTLLGPSGCGKTTTLRILAGFLSPDSGSVMLEGKDIASLPPYKRPFNTVFQRYALFPHLDVYDNIAFGLKLQKTPVDEIDKKVRKVLKMVSMTDYEDRDVESLSGGQQQRVSIGRAIVKNPDILLCDEPTGALDYNTSKEILKLIEDVNQKYGNTVIMVTHNEAIRHMADHVIKLRDGAVRHNDVNTDKVSAADLEW